MFQIENTGHTAGRLLTGENNNEPLIRFSVSSVVLIHTWVPEPL